MQKSDKKATVAFHTRLMGLGLMMLLFTLVIAPQGELEAFDYMWPITWLLEMTSLSLFVFGFMFGLLAGISARRAHIQRMKQEAADAQAADASDSGSRPEDEVKPTASAIPDALFTTPEPRVMVLNDVAKPNLEFPTSSKV